jgi:hypothetical protein
VFFATVGGAIIYDLATDVALEPSRFGDERATDRVAMKMSIELRSRLLLVGTGLRRGTLELVAGKPSQEATEKRTSRDDQRDGDQQFKDGSEEHELKGEDAHLVKRPR